MYKAVGPAQHHPTNRTLSDFHTYWGENHGPLFANTKGLRRYVQHLTLPEAYGIDPKPTFDGVSMFWFEELPAFEGGSDDSQVLELQRAVISDDAQLFDRTLSWPTHHKQANVTAEERVIVEGEIRPEMVKAIFIVSKLPGLTLNEFSDHWQNEHGAIAARLPGLRRYVQNHAVPEAYISGNQTHDGWSELWFDDLAALHRAAQSPEWKAVQEDGATLFGDNVGVGVARERIQKEFDWTYRDWGVGAMDEKQIHERLRDNRYTALAADPDAPARIKAAAAKKALALWTDKHLVIIDEPPIDARPDR